MERSGKYPACRCIRWRCVFIWVTLVFWWTLLITHHYSFNQHQQSPGAHQESCAGREIYLYELEGYFNEDMVRRCDTLSLWTNWCPSVQNAGLGPPMANTDGVFSDSDWYTTNQFMLEQIFHNRMRRYPCLTTDPSRAVAFFVPFYAGFEITTKLWRANVTERDAAPARLMQWLARHPSWHRFHGLDHFLVPLSPMHFILCTQLSISMIDDFVSAILR